MVAVPAPASGGRGTAGEVQPGHVRAVLGHSHAGMSARYAAGADAVLAAEVAAKAGQARGRQGRSGGTAGENITRLHFFRFCFSDFSANSSFRLSLTLTKRATRPMRGVPPIAIPAAGHPLTVT